MDRHSGAGSKADDHPSPADFDLYLPWACQQMQMEYVVQIIKVYQNEYVSVALTDRSKRGKSRGKIGHSRGDLSVGQEKEDRSASAMIMRDIYEKSAVRFIRVETVYDVCDNLVQVKFDRNPEIPRVMIKIFGLIIQFQNYLNTIIINGGLDKYTVHEICKFLPTSNITELRLDDCYLKEPNYHLFLENANFLKYLSLCRCKIDDETLEAICSKLAYPLPASKTLSILNLSSNRITDEGAKFLADILRSNRQLSYLNLASNMITDEGAALIFNTLIEFPLSSEEVVTSRCRKMTYLQHKNEMMAATIKELRLLGDSDKKSGKRKSIRPSTVKKPKGDISQSLDETRFLAEVDSALVEKATNIVENVLGEFVDPYSTANTFVRYGVMFCMGNNTLCNLNLSYNCLSYLSIRKLLSVLLYQKLVDRKPRGLLSISVEGNCIPMACKELWQIDNILEMNILTHCRRMSVSKKRHQTKGNVR